MKPPEHLGHTDLWLPTLRTEQRRAKDGAPSICGGFRIHLQTDLGCPILAQQGWDITTDRSETGYFQSRGKLGASADSLSRKTTQEDGKIGGQFRGQADALTGSWMGELEFRRVQKVTLQG